MIISLYLCFDSIKVGDFDDSAIEELLNRDLHLKISFMNT